MVSSFWSAVFCPPLSGRNVAIYDTMAVYVDRCRYPYKGMVMCHMLADTLDELHAMAGQVGMKPEWFQPGSTPHYDLNEEGRDRAIQLGAIPVDRKGLVAVIRRLRQKRGAKNELSPVVWHENV